MMNKIDKYIDTICKNFDESDEEVEILKEEMKEHLYEEVEELKKQGFSEEESIEKTLKNFGQEKTVVNEMNDVLEKQGVFWKGVVKVGILIFIIGCLFKVGSVFFKVDNTNYVNVVSEYTFNQVFDRLKDKNSIDEGSKLQINKIFDEFNKNNNNGLYYIKIEKSNVLNYEYKKEISKDMIQSGNEGKVEKNNWSMYYKKTDAQQLKDFENFNKFAEKNKVSVNNSLKETSNLLFIISIITLWISCYYYIFNGRKDIYLIIFMLLDILTTVWLAQDDKLIIFFISVPHILIFIIYKLYCGRKNVKV